VGKFLRLTPADRRLLVSALALLWAVRLALWLLPFRVVRRLFTKRSRPAWRQKEAHPSVVRRAAWAIRAASRYVPAATCLTQALAAQALLSCYGQESRLQIGVARDTQGGLRAHAWLETAGRVVIGAEEMESYTIVRIRDRDQR
jgi:hypothetical protein